LLAKAYSQFYSVEGRQPSQMAMACSVVSLLNNILDPNVVSSAGEMGASLMSCGIHPVIIPYHIEETIALARDPDVQNFIGKFEGHNRELYCHHRDQQVLMAGIFLLTLGKQVTSEGYQGWMENRVRSFRGSLGIPEGYCVWTPAQFPEQRALSAMNYFFSASFLFRRQVFLVCLSASTGTDKLSNLFRDVILLLQGAEMNHIILIDTYIFNKYPELLRIRLLRDNMLTYNSAMEFLYRLPAGERMYVKFLQPKDKTAVLNRNNFSLLALAAVVIARFENPSFKFYRGGAEDTLGASLRGMITSYLSFRVNMAPISMSYSSYAYMSAEEQQKLRQTLEKTGDQTPGLFSLPEFQKAVQMQ
jgi:hypothetical protein